MAGWSQNRRGSGIWKLTARLPSSAVHVWFLHDDGGRHKVMMMEMPFGAHPWSKLALSVPDLQRHLAASAIDQHALSASDGLQTASTTDFPQVSVRL